MVGTCKFVISEMHSDLDNNREEGKTDTGSLDPGIRWLALRPAEPSSFHGPFHLILHRFIILSFAARRCTFNP